MTDSYTAPSRAPRQLDIIADTALAKDLDNAVRSSTAPKNAIAVRSSTAAKSDNAVRSSTITITTIEARRIKLGITVREICVEADIRTETYYNSRANRFPTLHQTLLKLDKALDRFAAGTGHNKPETLCLAVLNLLIVELSVAAGLDPDIILLMDFSSECSNDPQWRAASRIRRQAMYILVEGIEIAGKADIAHALGNITRQGVHKAISTAEKERMADPRLDETMDVFIRRLKVRPRR